jgi:hypothetical protein
MVQPGSPWELPVQWREMRRQVNLTKPLNFIIDADVGSGAPGGVVLNQNGELIGMVIDTTLKSAVNRFPTAVVTNVQWRCTQAELSRRSARSTSQESLRMNSWSGKGNEHVVLGNFLFDRWSSPDQALPHWCARRALGISG